MRNEGEKIEAGKFVKLIVGLISADEALFLNVEGLLEKKFGTIDFKSKPIAFNYTDYYTQELGKNLKRLFLSFKRLINPAKISSIKIYTCKIEESLRIDKKRRINIDPGYLNLSRLVLATTKDFSHRIYLKNGIYAEITLIYKNLGFMPLEWTYPDYRTKDYIDIFNNIREIYRREFGPDKR